MTYPYEEFGSPEGNEITALKAEISRLKAPARDCYHIEACPHWVQKCKENDRLRAALRAIEDAPYTMVNDADSLRHTIKAMQAVARAALRPGT